MIHFIAGVIVGLVLGGAAVAYYIEMCCVGWTSGKNRKEGK
jgi:hypothetical protein